MPLIRHTTPKTKRLLVALALVVLLPCLVLLPALLLELDPLDLLVLAPVALLPVHTAATARDLATVPPDTTVPRQLAPAPAILKTHTVPLAPVRTAQLRVALAPVLTVKRHTPRALGPRKVDTLRRRTVDMDDLLRAPLVILKDRMDNRPPRRGTRRMETLT